MKISSHVAHIMLVDHKLKVGDRVAAFKYDCQDRKHPLTSPYGASCFEEKIGIGTVTQILNKHYSVVTFDENVKITEGVLLEKI